MFDPYRTVLEEKKIEPQQKTMRSQPATPVGGFQVLRNLSLNIKANGFNSVLLEFQCNFSSWDQEASRQSVFVPVAKPAGGRALLAMPPGAGILPLAAKQFCNSSTEIFA